MKLNKDEEPNITYKHKQQTCNYLQYDYTKIHNKSDTMKQALMWNDRREKSPHGHNFVTAPELNTLMPKELQDADKR